MSHPAYQIAQKILLKKDGKYLFLRSQGSNKYDLPGGRIDGNELYTPLSDILIREITEELGDDLKYKIGNPVILFRRYFEKYNLKVFLVVYEAEYISGEVRISDEHENLEWIDPSKVKLKAEDFFCEEEYQAFVEYFSKA